MKYFSVFILFLNINLIAFGQGDMKFNPRVVSAAERGNGAAMFKIGSAAVVYGETENDFATAEKWLTAAAAQGVKVANPFLFQLGVKTGNDQLRFKYADDAERGRCYLNGIGTLPDPRKALEIWDSMPSMGVTFDEYERGRILVGHNEVTASPQLIESIKSKAQSGDARAMYEYAMLCDQDLSEQAKWLYRASAAGEKYASFVILYKYLSTPDFSPLTELYPPYTHTDPNDREKFHKWFADVYKIAGNGDVMFDKTAVKFFNDDYLHGSNGYEFYVAKPILCLACVEKYDDYRSLNEKAEKRLRNKYQGRYHILIQTDSPKKRLKHYQEAAERGDGYYANEVGNIYYSGDRKYGVTEDKQQAYKWYQKAVELGHLSAWYDLGYMTEHGIGTNPDINKAVEYYKMAWNNDLSTSEFSRGDMSIRFGEHGILSSNAIRAMTRYAYLLESKAIEPTGDESAFDYYYLAAMNYFAFGKYFDNPWASEATLYKVAEMIDYGNGCEENPGLALWWYNKWSKCKDAISNKESEERLPFQLYKAALERMKSMTEDKTTPIEDYLFVRE